MQSIVGFGPWAAISARKNDFLIKETLDEIVADTIKVIKQGIADIGNWNVKKNCARFFYNTFYATQYKL